jgi:hypothetical protein
VGFFNSAIKVAVDTDWLLRATSIGINFKKIPSITYMRSGGISDIYRYTGMGEYADALIRNGYSEVHILIFLLLRLLGKFRDLITRRRFI